MPLPAFPFPSSSSSCREDAPSSSSFCPSTYTFTAMGHGKAQNSFQTEAQSKETSLHGMAGLQRGLPRLRTVSPAAFCLQGSQQERLQPPASAAKLLDRDPGSLRLIPLSASLVLCPHARFLPFFLELPLGQWCLEISLIPLHTQVLYISQG